MEPEGSLPYLQEPATSTYPEPDRSNPQLTSLRSILILSSHLCLGLQTGLFPSGLLLKHSYKVFWF